MDHHHEEEEEEEVITLPLRLAAEPYARESLSSSCVALSVHPEIALLVDDRGILALACQRVLAREELRQELWNKSSATSTSSLRLSESQLAEILPPSQPVLLLVRNSSLGNSFHWRFLEAHQEVAEEISLPKQQQQRNGQLHQLLQEKLHPLPNHLPSTAQWIVTSIRTYYAQQILEPSVRGFLSVLEKQFSQSNLYIFELLQNAVDDDATVVTFQAIPMKNKNSSNHRTNNENAGGCLQMTHNGRQFTPLDVLGLSSVGLSTKSREGKRTIGFMGVGFKAVYKRYAQVTIDDGVYAFRYQEPSQSQSTSASASTSNGNSKPQQQQQGNYGWVMMPLWQTPHHNQSEGCQFSLEKPRGGYPAILKDLAVLPKTAPPLLGRAALLKQEHEQPQKQEESNSWTLDWNGKVHQVQRTQIQRYGTNGMSEVVTVQISRPDGTAATARTDRWLFVTHEYRPSREACESYHRHTKRTHTGKESVCGFVPLTPDGIISLSSTTNTGVVHSVLPTKIRLPIPLHLQGSFLLSVDRQQVQDLSDNAWNLDILTKLPHLLAVIFQWAAQQQNPSNYPAIAKLLPQPAPDNITTTLILNQAISLKPLQQVLHHERTLPVAIPAAADKDTMEVDGIFTSSASTTTTDYYEGSKTIWVPPVFHKLLKADLLRDWLGRRPLRSDAFGNEGAYHPFFLQVVDTMDPLPNRTRQLGDHLQLPRNSVTTTAIQRLLQMMAAIGIAYQESPKGMEPTNGSTKPNNNNSNNNDKGGGSESPAGPSLPSPTTVWPVFLNENGSLSTIDQIILPDEDLARVPEDLLELLRPYFIKGEHSSAKGTSFHKQRGAKRKFRQQAATVYRLHPTFETAILGVESGKSSDEVGLADGIKNWDLVSMGALSFLKLVRSENAKHVVDISTAVSNLLEAYSVERICSTEHIENIVNIAKFAMETNNDRLFSHVLVDSTAGTKLVPAAQAYLGKAFDESGPGADLESFAGTRLEFLSSAYLSVLGSQVKRRRFANLVTSSGVQTGLAVTITAVMDIQKDKNLLAEVLPNLPDKKLPQLRNKNPKNEIMMPYGLGMAMNRKSIAF